MIDFNKICILLMSAWAAHLNANNVDLRQSAVVWTGSKVTGSSHTGTIQIKNANVTFENGKISRGRIVVDMGTIANTDIKRSSAKDNLEGHLNGSDFFATSDFPEAVLKIKKSKHLAGDNYNFRGSLTIKDISFPVSFKASKICPSALPVTA